MKTILLVFLTFLLSFNANAQLEENYDTTDETILIFTRHAEKEAAPDPDPSLSEEGQKRVEKLKVLLQRYDSLDAIYSTDYNRTRQTADPVAGYFNKSVTIYDPRNLEAFKQMILETHTNDKILIVGHSNTTPALINLIMGEERLEPFDEKDYSNLYIIRIPHDEAPVLKHYKY